MSCEATFFRELKQRGFRLTPQREMVLSVMHRIEGMATAEEVYQQVQLLSSSVDISTVYRTLDLLKDFDLVSTIDGADGQLRFELRSVHGSHMHLVCSRCGSALGADLEVARELAAAVRSSYGFEIDLSNLTFSGLCPACRALEPVPASS